MTCRLLIPDDIARCLGDSVEAVTRVALEALAVEGSRSGRLTTEQVRQLLGLGTRYEADGFLKQHAVYHPLTVEQVKRDAATAWEFSRCR